MTVFYVLLSLVLAMIALSEVYSFFTGVPTVTSSPAVRRAMIALLRKEAAARGRSVESPLRVLDLGSGTGKLALAIGRALPETQVRGLEISPAPFFLSLLRRLVWRLLWRVRNVQFERTDFWPYNLSGTDVVVLYINGQIRERMADKLARELPAGALIISNETHLPGWVPFETQTVGLLKVKLVAYRKEGARV